MIGSKRPKNASSIFTQHMIQSGPWCVHVDHSPVFEENSQARTLRSSPSRDIFVAKSLMLPKRVAEVLFCPICQGGKPEKVVGKGDFSLCFRKTI